jgi:predicted Rossmann fold flavoprotein
MKNILVAGAGPAGMMAAIRACQLGQQVTLLEKNPTAGRKLLLSGKGRCNLTNACSLELFLERFSHGQFLRDSFKKFFNIQLIDFFERRGLKLIVERQQRVFPAAGTSSSVLDVLCKEIVRCRVQLLLKVTITDIVVASGRVTGAVLSGGKRVQADSVILATGGESYAFTGSTGDGQRIAARHGHMLVSAHPGLVPLVVKKDFDLPEGLTLKNIRLIFHSGKKAYETEIGEMLFTASGISGPLVLTWSGKVVDLLKSGPVQVSIDLKPGLSPEQIESRFLRDVNAAPRLSIRNVLKEYLPLRMIDIFLKQTGISPQQKANQVRQQERRKLIGLLKDFRMKVTGSLPLEEAMVTRGGVSLKEIDPKTMESRLIKGLYFCGEMIDVDADTGGFNLQAAFSTGYLAGDSAATTLI